MTTRPNNYEMPAVAPALQEYDWERERERQHELDVVVTMIDTTHLPPLPGREPVRKDN